VLDSFCCWSLFDDNALLFDNKAPDINIINRNYIYTKKYSLSYTYYT